MASRSLCQGPPLTSSSPLALPPSSSSAKFCSCPLSTRFCGRSLHWGTSLQKKGARCDRLFVHVVAETAEVAVAPSPTLSDGLTMNLKVEGTLADSLIPKVTSVLKSVEGVSNLKVYSSEGIATVELAKQTTIQATGEASSLLEKIQLEGFKLQNLSISFEDPAADANEDIAYEYESST